ncbi:MAG: glycoside hydrolase family 32 protein [Candidatus Omnitrophica bacterium]|nr:glycoside hydrolase family 32 protein [Candidatus Omnitrophota bacterium]
MGPPICAATEPAANPAILKASESVEQERARAEADPQRPVFHFRPPARWMNDPNGTLFHGGFFHVFYQHNPFGDMWGHMHWGHARSKDLVHWEHLPIALWPSEEKGEGHCFSGCAAIDKSGKPFLLYTSVPPKAEDRPHEQWAAMGSDDLRTWEKHPGNPVITLDQSGAPRLGGAWRDPFVFRDAGRTFLVLGADLGEEAVIPIYEAPDGDLSKWVYRGILYRRPKSEVPFFECPNFFQLGDKWVLFYSPYRPVEYAVGRFDREKLTFTPEQEGKLDASDQFYASNVAFGPSGECILFGWVRGFPEGRGWNGCLALPRVLTLSSDGRPIQRPVPALETLRGTPFSIRPMRLSSESKVLDGISGDRLEIRVSFRPESAAVFGVRLRRSEDGARGVNIGWSGGDLDIAGFRVPLEDWQRTDSVELEVYLDKSVLEVFVNGGETAITRVLSVPKTDLWGELYAEGGTVEVMSFEAHPLKSIW